ncbi:DNA-3-methyladenine glycosylase I [bacterium]|nr:DNA-3-methyladenine glycosylase I [bacterium]NCQ55544.1 DNA-3-methyladenine glycosylase I [Candidatus Parcubacteria bacterium]NCS67555.1 DNA-3-methyladenine glycosylase I [Candidatus Peregrinibacteria bacterium]NCS96280.1 DNA-3-methyladenine glycosylase I [bacterium]
MKTRCAWVTEDLIYIKYHDEEWGRPVYDDDKLFAKLCLEGAQAGLSWITVLKKRPRYFELFNDLSPKKVAAMSDDELEATLTDSGIIRNRLKVYSMRTNALAFLAVQKEFGSFSKYLWDWVGNEPQVNHPKTLAEVPARTELSDALAKDLKARGFKFMGSTIVYAYLQSMGLVIDHTTDCFCYCESYKN